MLKVRQLRDKLVEMHVYLMQDEFEFDRLLYYYEKLRPQVSLEIGSFNGGSLYCFAMNSQPTTHLISIDIPTGDSNVIRDTVFAEIHKTHTLTQIPEPSECAYNQLSSVLQGQMLDFLFIDGNHGNADRDYRIYEPCVRKGGIIAFHDVMYQFGNIFTTIKNIGLNKFTVICGQNADMGIAFMEKK